jgi:protein-disulfide isomerase
LVAGVWLTWLGCTSFRGVSTDEPPAPGLSILEYSDFQCPYAAGGQPVVERVLAVYGKAVRYEYRHFTIGSHPQAIPAARRYEALRAHDPAAADRFRRLLFRHQDRLELEGEDYLDEVIAELGYDPLSIAREAKDPAISRRLKSQMAEAEALGLIGTPGYVVAGTVLKEATPFSEFERILCGELRKMRPVQGDGSESMDTDCWSLVDPDWQLLDELDSEELSADPPGGH